MLNKKSLETYRKQLNERLDSLLDEAKQTVSIMSDEGQNLPDPADRATLESDRNFELRIRDRERKLIGKIKDAIERIDNKTFGICEDCEEEISQKRLKARPVTTLCVSCKTKQETMEKARGL